MRSLVALCLVLSVPACGSGLRDATRFDGHAETSLVAPSQIGEVSVLPTGYDRLGEVSARCVYHDGARPPEGALLSDVDCSESRLLAALKERAADVGGELLVGRRCRSRVLHEDEESQRLAVSCDAIVARPGDDLLAERPLRRPAMAEVDDVPASAAWRIRVKFAENPAVPARPPRALDYVREVGDVPVGRIALGDVVAVCRKGCSEAAVREGVLIAAGRFGATDVAGVRCAAKGEGYMCLGTAAAYEVDPDLEPRAR